MKKDEIYITTDEERTAEFLRWATDFGIIAWGISDTGEPVFVPTECAPHALEPLPEVERGSSQEHDQI